MVLKARLFYLLGLAPSPPKEWLVQSREDNCAQTVVAMLLDVPVSQVNKYVGNSGSLSVSEALNILSRNGIHCRPVSATLAADFWTIYKERAGGRKLKGIAFKRKLVGERYGHAFFIFGKYLYDPADGSFRKLKKELLKELDWIALLPRDEARV